MTEKESRDPTQAEIDATVAKLLSEARKNDSEASKNKAEAKAFTYQGKEFAALARTAEIRVAQDELKLELIMEGERKRRAADLEHRIYRFYSGVTSSTVEACVKQLTEWHRMDPECDIEIIFNCPGGSVIDGFELFDFLVDLGTKGHRVTTGCTGMAASMAGILMQAGEHRWMSRESWYMIHQAAFGVIGKTFDVEDTLEWVKRIETRIVNIFSSRSDLTAAKIRANWKRKDWWIDSDEALKHRLVDEIRASSLPKANTETT